MMGSYGYRRTDVALILERARSTEGARDRWRPESLLPLTDAAYLVLLILGTPRLADHGSLDALEDAARARGIVPGTLESTLDRLIEQELVAPEGAPEQGRYRVTELGSAVLFAEAGRRQRYTVRTRSGSSRSG